MKNIKDLTIKVTYRVGLGNVEVPDEVYNELAKAYDADIGDSPEDWATVYGITDDEIERKATEQEMDRKYRESMRQLREQGILE